MPTDIHHTAIVSDGAKIGAGVRIGPYSVIGENVSLGDGCEIGSSVLIDGYTTMGKDNRVFHGASIGTAPQDLKYREEKTLVSIGDGNTIREFATINSATGEGEATIVGNNCLLMAYVHVAHNCVVGDNVVLSNAVNLAGHVTVEDWAILGGLVPVHQFVRIGMHSYIGGGSRIAQDIPPFFKFAGSPPRPSGLNKVGMERRGFTAQQTAVLKKAYRLLYRSDLNVSQAVEKIKEEVEDTPEVRALIEFIAKSERGLTR